MTKEKEEEEDTKEISGQKLDEARFTVNNQLQVANSNEDKAFRLLQFNLTALAAIFTAFSVVPSINASVTEFINIPNALALFLLLGSIVTAAISFLSGSKVLGVNAGMLQVEIDTADEMKNALVESYSKWISENRKSVQFQSYMTTYSIIMFVNCLIFAIYGVSATVSGSVGSFWYYVFLIIIMISGLFISSTAYYSDRFAELLMTN
ncbi:hypothetical protein ACFQFH_05615 [Halobaculum halobium]|uniref:Uncharacterized protein n=1 Tax=Halobaculum halobium TaxID=3032281 RepID=A0ABD5TDA7_9EURY|nr:hypothetical protein [Halobaculum sp. SYNS20]